MQLKFLNAFASNWNCLWKCTSTFKLAFPLLIPLLPFWGYAWLFPCSVLALSSWYFFQQPQKKKEIKMEPCGDAHSNLWPRQGSLCVAQPNGWVTTSLGASITPHPPLQGGIIWTKGLDAAQASGRGYFLAILWAVGQWDPGAQALCFNTQTPQAHWSCTAQHLGMAAAPRAAPAVLWRRRWEIRTNHLEGQCLFLLPLVPAKYCPCVPWL